MSKVEEHVVERPNPEVMFRFVATLIVTTLMVAVTAFALSYAVLAPERMGAAHGAAPSMQHART